MDKLQIGAEPSIAVEQSAEQPHAPAPELRPEAAEDEVIVAVDGRRHDADALALARTLQTAIAGALVIVHVVPPAPPGRGIVECEALEWRDGRELLAQTVENWGDAVHTELVGSYPPAQGLSRLAAERHASMLVLGSSHRGTVGSVVPGRTASHLITRTPCLVAVAPAGYASAGSTSISAIGVAYDGTSGSDLALAAAVGMASKLAVPLRLYHVMHKISADPSWDLFREHMHKLAQGILDRGLRQVPDDLVATSRVLEDGAAEEIAGASSSDEIGLLYVGSRGYGPLREALAGGVVGGLLGTARCPLVIVPESSASVAQSL